MPSEESSPQPDDREIEDEIAQVEQALIALQERYNQVKRDTIRRDSLLEQKSELENTGRNNAEIKAELQQIQQELETVEVNLESHLFSWSSLKEPFWQAVRFGGLGVVLGWILNALAS